MDISSSWTLLTVSDCLSDVQSPNIFLFRLNQDEFSFLRSLISRSHPTESVKFARSWRQRDGKTHREIKIGSFLQKQHQVKSPIASLEQSDVNVKKTLSPCWATFTPTGTTTRRSGFKASSSWWPFGKAASSSLSGTTSWPSSSATASSVFCTERSSIRIRPWEKGFILFASFHQGHYHSSFLPLFDVT